MQLRKSRIIQVGAIFLGFFVAFSVGCHFFNFLMEGKINRIYLLVVLATSFGGLLYWASREHKFSWIVKIPKKIQIILLGIALVLAAAFCIFASQRTTPLPPNYLGISFWDLSITAKIWLAGLILSDFIVITTLIFISGCALYRVISSDFKTSSLAFRAYLFPIILVVGCVINLVVNRLASQQPMYRVRRLPDNSLETLDRFSSNRLDNLQLYVRLYKDYAGSELIAPGLFIEEIKLHREKLILWGQLKDVVLEDYPLELTPEQMQNISDLEWIALESGFGVSYYLPVEENGSQEYCLKIKDSLVYWMPTRYTPECLSTQ